MPGSGEQVEEQERREGASGGAGDDPADFKPKRRGALWVGFGIAILATLAVAVAFTRETREPLRVLVAVDAEGYWWEGSTTAARLLDNVVPHLKKLGFDVVQGGDPAVLKLLEGAASPEGAAQRAQASFVVTGPALLGQAGGLGDALRGRARARGAGPRAARRRA